MKGIIKEIFIHIMIWIFLFSVVFGAVTLATQEIKEDIAQIEIDINNIAKELKCDLHDECWKLITN